MNGIDSAMLWDWITRQTIQVTIVAAAVFVLVKLFARDRPHLAHALWAVVLLKSLTPPLIALPTSPFSLLAMVVPGEGTSPPFQPTELGDVPSTTNTVALSNLKSQPSISTIFTSNAHSFTPTVEANPSDAWTWREIILSAWLASSLAWLASIVFRLNRFLGRVRRTAMDPQHTCVQSLTIRMQGVAAKVHLPAWRTKHVRVRVVDSLIGPAVVGIFRPMILLPKMIVDESSDEELDLLLTHELIHVRRGDLGWAMLQTVAKCAWWFHPLMTWAARRFAHETERRCDEETIACSGCHPHSYARVLLTILDKKHQLHVAPALPGVRPMDITMKRMDRIMRLTQRNNGSPLRNPWWCRGAMMLGALIAIPGAVWAVPQTADAPIEPVADVVAENEHDSEAVEKVSIQTRFIRIPADALKDVVVDWQLQESANAEEAISDSFQPPMLTAQLDPASLQILLAAVQGKSTQDLGAPTITMHPGQEATIKDQSQRPFVTGMRDSAQPTVSILPEGIEVNVLLESRGRNFDLSCRVKLSKIKDVGTFTYRTTSKEDGEATTLQVPTLASATFRCEAVDIPAGGSFVMATPNPGNSNEIALAAITLVTNEQVKLRERLSKHYMQAASTKSSQYTVYTRVSILGPITSGGPPRALDPPSDDHILKAARKLPHAKALLEWQAESPDQTIRIIKEKVADYVDPLKFYPLIGKAHLHHAHYKCTLHGMIQTGDFTVPKEGDQPEAQVMYIDHNHFHMIGEEKGTTTE